MYSRGNAVDIPSGMNTTKELEINHLKNEDHVDINSAYDLKNIGSGRSSPSSVGGIDVESSCSETKDHTLQTNTPSLKKAYSKKKEKSNHSARVEDGCTEVKKRFEDGCECSETNCFDSFNVDFVHKHRLNIAELTKSEHDMYLMGITAASLSNPDETSRHKERKRLRAKYVFQGKEVCLEAFLYLENCTHYQLKRIRKHVMQHGITPRVHGNCGKKPHNTFSLDIYQLATAFLRGFIKLHGTKTVKKEHKKATVVMQDSITRKYIYREYVEFCQCFEPTFKTLGYSTFRNFLKEQYPNVKFSSKEKSDDG